MILKEDKSIFGAVTITDLYIDMKNPKKSVLGKGVSGIVYLAYHKKLKKKFAVKIVSLLD